MKEYLFSMGSCRSLIKAALIDIVNKDKNSFALQELATLNCVVHDNGKYKPKLDFLDSIGFKDTLVFVD